MQRNRSIQQRSDDSENQLKELLNWLTDGFDERSPFSQIKAYHDVNNLPEFWLLGSSQWSAYTAGSLGLNYSFAGFINPNQAYNLRKSICLQLASSVNPLGRIRRFEPIEPIER